MEQEYQWNYGIGWMWRDTPQPWWHSITMTVLALLVLTWPFWLWLAAVSAMLFYR